MFPPIWLSPTTLNMGAECQRCLWDALLWKHKRPKGIFPSLPRGVDDGMKNYCDKYRGTLPPMLKALIPQTPELEEYVLHADQRWLNTMRDWKGGLIASIKIDNQVYKLSGAIDDLLVRQSDGALAILDGKSKAKIPEAGEGQRYYGAQMNTYDLIFKKCGFETAGTAFLWYVCPVAFNDADLTTKSSNLVMDNFMQQVPANADLAMAQIQGIHEMLMKHPDRSKPPESGNCEYCVFAGR